MKLDELTRSIDEVLIQNMPPGLKAAIDRLLARGASKLAVLTAVKAFAAKAATKPGQGTFTVAQVEAYLETLP